MAFNTRLLSIPPSAPAWRIPAGRAEAWRTRLPSARVARIGLVWAGKPSHRNDHNRSIAFARLAPLLSQTGVEFVSLQQEVRDADRLALKNYPTVLQIGPALADFADTAALVGELDLVITVDTAVAHLAGAMGMPVWILLPFCPDWRWLLDREDSPLYSTARLFRQPRIGDWDSVIERLRQELALVAAPPRGAAI